VQLREVEAGTSLRRIPRAGRLTLTLRMTDSLINKDNVISDLCLKSNAAMIDTRRLEKDF